MTERKITYNNLHHIKLTDSATSPSRRTEVFREIVKVSMYDGIATVITFPGENIFLSLSRLKQDYMFLGGMNLFFICHGLPKQSKSFYLP